MARDFVFDRWEASYFRTFIILSNFVANNSCRNLFSLFQLDLYLHAKIHVGVTSVNFVCNRVEQTFNFRALLTTFSQDCSLRNDVMAYESITQFSVVFFKKEKIGK